MFLFFKTQKRHYTVSENIQSNVLFESFNYKCGAIVDILTLSPKSTFAIYYTILQNKRMRRCGVAPPPIIFERLKLPRQIIHRRKGNLSESPNHQKCWENILISRFYEQFSRNSRILGHFWKFEKISSS